MNAKLTLVTLSLCAACASQKPMQPAAAADPAESATIESVAPASVPTVVYHQFDGEPRAYVPLEAAACQANDEAQVLFQPRAIWWFDPDAGDWTSVADIAGEVRIACNAMIAVEDVLGQNLEIGTFAIHADIDGSPEHGVFYNGDVLCNDIDLGTPPDGEVALCIGRPDAAEARFVRDPASLTNE